MSSNLAPSQKLFTAEQAVDPAFRKASGLFKSEAEEHHYNKQDFGDSHMIIQILYSETDELVKEKKVTKRSKDESLSNSISRL